MNNNMMSHSYRVIILGIIVSLLVITIGVSFAFFTAIVTGAESGTTLTVSGGTMNITYAGGATITASNIIPGSAAVATKTITITGNNTTSATMKYTLTLRKNSNTFSSNALKYTLDSTNTGSNGTIIPAKTTQQNITTGSGTMSLGTGNFAGTGGVNKVHTYVLKIFFPDTGANQNIEQGKSFTGRVDIEAVQ